MARRKEEATQTEPQAPEATEIDTAAFEQEVNDALEQRDLTTGTLPAVALEAVKTAYRGLDSIKAKNQGKSYLAQGMGDSITAGDIVLARTYQELSKAIQAPTSAGPKERKPKEPVNPTQAHVEHVVTLDLARASVVEPEGLDDDHQSQSEKLFQELFPQVETYRTWLGGDPETRGDEPEVSPVVRAATKLASGKGTKTRKGAGGGSGVRRDIGKHIAEAFESLNTGDFLTVAEIAKFESSEYGVDHPSAGAVSARLFPRGGGQTTVEGVVAGSNEKGTKGASKA